MYYVYIIYSPKLNKKYIGFSTDLERRIGEHNIGKCISTANGKPWRLIYHEVFISAKDARVEELFLKSGKGRERLKYLLKNTLQHGEFA